MSKRNVVVTVSNDGNKAQQIVCKSFDPNTETTNNKVLDAANEVVNRTARA